MPATAHAYSGSPLLVTFVAGVSGEWSVDRISPVVGESLAPAASIAVREGRGDSTPAGSVWSLRGVTSNARYTTRAESDALTARQAGLHRPSATRAALIPIRKSPAWWALAQDERRAIFEAESRHTTIGLEYLPAIARRLHHCRELHEPFDFLTWFEYAPEHEDQFEELVRRLRATKEWEFVDREVDIRLSRVEPAKGSSL